MMTDMQYLRANEVCLRLTHPAILSPTATRLPPCIDQTIFCLFQGLNVDGVDEGCEFLAIQNQLLLC